MRFCIAIAATLAAVVIVAIAQQAWHLPRIAGAIPAVIPAVYVIIRLRSSRR